MSRKINACTHKQFYLYRHAAILPEQVYYIFLQDTCTFSNYEKKPKSYVEIHYNFILFVARSKKDEKQLSGRCTRGASVSCCVLYLDDFNF